MLKLLYFKRPMLASAQACREPPHHEPSHHLDEMQRRLEPEAEKNKKTNKKQKTNKNKTKT